MFDVVFLSKKNVLPLLETHENNGGSTVDSEPRKGMV